MVISWAKENGLLPSGRAVDDGQGLLIISSVKYEDSGTYICTATSGRFIKTSTAVLNVGGNAVLCKSYISLKEFLSNLTVKSFYLSI
jgi:hypothetical protein